MLGVRPSRAPPEPLLEALTCYVRGMSSSPFRRILIPIDFTDDTDAAVHSGLDVESGANMVAQASIKALELAVGIVDEGGSLCLVHATPSYEVARVYTGGAGMGVGMGELAEVHANARAASLEVLEKLVERYAPGITCSFVVRPGIALQVILEEAEKCEAQLIVIPASGRSRVARFFLGSTADRVIRQSPCPVLVVPPVPTPE
jgi:nucleotide-binding universal stress UspA family protein